MNIIDALKNENLDLRVSYGRRWLIYDTDHFVVYGTSPYGKKVQTYYNGNYEHEAVKILLED